MFCFVTILFLCAAVIVAAWQRFRAVCEPRTAGRVANSLGSICTLPCFRLFFFYAPPNPALLLLAGLLRMNSIPFFFVCKQTFAYSIFILTPGDTIERVCFIVKRNRHIVAILLHLYHPSHSLCFTARRICHNLFRGRLRYTIFIVEYNRVTLFGQSQQLTDKSLMFSLAV